VLSFYSEFLGPDEHKTVRTAMSRVRGLGAIWAANPAWDVEEMAEDDHGCGFVEAETFRVLRLDHDDDYVAPIRVRSAFSYALEDELGIEMKSNSPTDAKDSFGPLQLKRLGMWVSGPDHVRDALAHVLFQTRKQYSE
jgi:hypothetical protein